MAKKTKKGGGNREKTEADEKRRLAIIERHKDQKRVQNIQPAPVWVKGQSGNPNGRPKGVPNRSTILKKYAAAFLKDKSGKKVNNPFDENSTAMTVEEAIYAKLTALALQGNMKAIIEVLDTLHGKNPDIISGDPESPLKTVTEIRITAPKK